VCERNDDCNGRLCDEVPGDAGGVCTGPCVLGQLAGCGFAEGAVSRDVVCLSPLVQSGRFSEGVGDIGLCREVCDEDTDCLLFDLGWGCSPLSPAAAEFFGRSGACVPLSPEEPPEEP
jgi:hypothetical protein